MDADRFDALSRTLGQAISRQRLLRRLAGVSAAALAALNGIDGTWAARKKRGKKRKRRTFCAPDSQKKIALCHCPPGNPENAHVICVDASSCGGHGNDLPCDCICGKAPAGCVDHEGQPFPRCDPGRCRRDGTCAPGGAPRTTCQGPCNIGNFPCPTDAAANCRCQLRASGLVGACVDCPPQRICGLACCSEGLICCDGTCVDPATLCGGVCGNVCAAEETCCGAQCVPTADLCPDCTSLCSGAAVCCGGGCSTSVACCLNAQCHQVCQTGVCTNGTCTFTPSPPGQQGPFCNRPGEVCCEENDAPVCCQNGAVCIASGCCQPRTCDAFPGRCGPQANGCGGQTADCPCPDGQTCTAAGTCITPECVPDAIEVACAGLACGPASNGCGVDYDCGACGANDVCVTGVCKVKAHRKKHCAGNGLAGQPCGGKKCKCKGGRRCHNGICCEAVEDGSKHCGSNNDCCPGLMCARRRPGQHKLCMRRNAKVEEESAPGSLEQAGDAYQG